MDFLLVQKIADKSVNMCGPVAVITHYFTFTAAFEVSCIIFIEARLIQHRQAHF